MKYKYLIQVFLLVASQASAKVRTVSNNPATIAQYNTIQTAVDASAIGDTVYVHGSQYNYEAFTITDKRLVIMGPGFIPDKQFPFPASVNGFTITGTGSSNSTIQGIRVVSFNSGQLKIQAPYPSGLTFIRNIFDGGPNAPNAPRIEITGTAGLLSNYVFESNVFNGYGINNQNQSGNTIQNFLFRNNYFYASTAWYNSGFFDKLTNCTNVLFDHNLFMGPNASANGIPVTGLIFFANGCAGFTFSNNIIIRLNMAANNTGSIFYNNLVYDAVNNTPWASNGNTDGGGNIENQDPKMVAQVAVNAGIFNPIADYTIAAGPANNTASDGKDMGLLYDAIGPYNWANARNSGLPRISKMSILNTTVQQGATINIAIEAKTSN